jgi:hypothetical protein
MPAKARTSSATADLGLAEDRIAERDVDAKRILAPTSSPATTSTTRTRSVGANTSGSLASASCATKAWRSRSAVTPSIWRASTLRGGRVRRRAWDGPRQGGARSRSEACADPAGASAEDCPRGRTTRHRSSAIGARPRGQLWPLGWSTASRNRGWRAWRNSARLSSTSAVAPAIPATDASRRAGRGHGDHPARRGPEWAASWWFEHGAPASRGCAGPKPELRDSNSNKPDHLAASARREAATGGVTGSISEPPSDLQQLRSLGIRRVQTCGVDGT